MISIRKSIIVVAALLIVTAVLSGAALAGPKLDVEEKGSYIYWFAYKDGLGDDRVTQPERFKGTDTELETKPLGETFTGAKLYVMDKRTGNMAILDYKAPEDPKKPKPITLKQGDFEYVRSVWLKIVSEDGAPVESGIVTITDGEGTEMRAILTPVNEGVVLFENVATGEMNVKVRAEGAVRTIDSDVELPAKRSRAAFEQDIRVAGDVDTLPVAAGKGESKVEPAVAEKPGKGSGGKGAVLQFITGLVFLAVIIAVVAVVIRAKGITAKQALQRMGVELPEDGQIAGAPAAVPEPAVDPSVCAFCGQKKDPAGNCACTLGAAPSPFAAPAQGASGGPRLIGTQGAYSGHIFELAGGSAVVGREAGNAVALVNDGTASRRHATITATNGDYFIRDEGSSNGTFVNGARITEQKLTPGDEIQIGGSKFRFEA